MSAAVPASLSTPVVKVSKVSKEYRIYDSPGARLRSLISSQTKYKSHWALQDISFELRPGQCLGVIGDNGAGKSSLLKLMAGTMQPSSGKVERVGRVTAILELGAGFHPEFSGRQNLHFAGSLMGFSSAELVELEASIIAFSELGDAIDRPIKTYSSGMVVRLAFALVTAVVPELLIVDEALAVGDQHFQKKCTERIDEFRRSGCTILFCSHSLYHVRHLCDVALWLDKGRVRALGETETVLASYETHVRAQDGAVIAPHRSIEQNSIAKQVTSVVVAPDDGKAGIVSVQIANLGPGDSPLLQSKDLAVTVVARGQGDVPPSIGVMLEQLHGVGITSLASHAEGVQPKATADGSWRITLTFPDLPLHTGEYVVSAYLFDAQGLVVYDEWLHYLTFKLVHHSLTPGLVRLPHHWT